jgi:hypothetical protein
MFPAPNTLIITAFAPGTKHISSVLIVCILAAGNGKPPPHFDMTVSGFLFIGAHSTFPAWFSV